MEKSTDGTETIARKFITPLDIENGFSGKLSLVGYKIGSDMSFLVFSGCQHSVTFKFDPSRKEEALQKLQNLKDAIFEFEEDFKKI